MGTPRPFVAKTQRAKRRARTSPVNLRRVINGLLSLLETGCQWALLSEDFGCDKTVNASFNTWCKDGTFKRIQQVLTREERLRQGRLSIPMSYLLLKRLA